MQARLVGASEPPATALLLGKKIARPAPSFPSSLRRREPLYWGRRRRPRRSFGANVDSLHILSDRPWRASRKMLHSPRRAQGLSERQRVKTCSEYRSAARTLAGAARRPATRQEIPLSCDMVEGWGDSFPFGPGGPKVARRAEGLRAPASRTRSEYCLLRAPSRGPRRPFFFQVVGRCLQSGLG